MPKHFFPHASEIKRLLPNLGSCFATDRITVDGRPVGFMYRDLPDEKNDSGWRFFSGDEDQSYADKPNNFGLYDVNTIATYDPDIIAHLDAPSFSAFERDPTFGHFVPTSFPG